MLKSQAKGLEITFSSSWPWPLTNDPAHWTWPRYGQGKPPLNDSLIGVHTQTYTQDRFYYPGDHAIIIVTCRVSSWDNKISPVCVCVCVRHLPVTCSKNWTVWCTCTKILRMRQIAGICLNSKGSGANRLCCYAKGLRNAISGSCVNAGAC